MFIGGLYTTVHGTATTRLTALDGFTGAVTAPTFSDVSGEALSTLGDLLKGRGRFQEALPLLERAHGILVAARGERGEFVGTTKGRLAYVLSRLGEKDRALVLQRESNAAYEALEGAESSNSLIGRLALADMLVSVDRCEEAEPIYLAVVETASRTFGAQHPIVTKAKIGLGVMLMRNERWGAAEPFVREATEAGRRDDGLDRGSDRAVAGDLSGHRDQPRRVRRQSAR